VVGLAPLDLPYKSSPKKETRKAEERSTIRFLGVGRGFLVGILSLDGHSIALVQPTPQIDPATALAAKRQRRAFVRLELLLADGTTTEHGEQ